VHQKKKDFMMNEYAKIIHKELNLSENQVISTIKLLDEGATVPFISRYRKEMTGSLDEVEVADIKSLYLKYREIDARRAAILKSIEEQGALTDELRQKIEATWSKNELEDLYLPYKPKRKTRATKARELGLEPLATELYKQQHNNVEPLARKFLTDLVTSEEDALQGARDIMAEWINEDLTVRERLRGLFERTAVLSTSLIKDKEAEAAKYKDYFEFDKPLKKMLSHQTLAIRRAEAEGFLRVDISPDEEETMFRLNKLLIKSTNQAAEQVEMAIKDAYKRLLKPSLETDFRLLSKELADKEAILVFTENLRQLLLASPLGEQRTLALDPGFRTGCKVVCLDKNGELLENSTIYPHPPQNNVSEAAKTIKHLVEKHQIQAISIGNGTAGRETEQFVRDLKLTTINTFVVSEAGASIYSASQVARDEFPDHDVTVRGAISIGRRLMDPLAELVKIDPKSIGVGQYQHDVDQKQLQESLDDTVVRAVNHVGVNLNTASKHLLTYVSGLGPALAQSIVNYRTEIGAFKTRDQLKKVPRLGAKAYEQCAGFLRIRNAENPLDASAVHPERYALVGKMAKDLGCTVNELVGKSELTKKIELKQYVSDEVGLPTLKDILKELDKPGLDPREPIQSFSFDPNIRAFSDVTEGLVLPGIVSNITAFGAFVDIGIKDSGLLHKSQIANKYVENPADYLKLGQQLVVKVIGIDTERKRIQLSLNFS
jgi:uncharacterized protein